MVLRLATLVADGSEVAFVTVAYFHVTKEDSHIQSWIEGWLRFNGQLRIS